MLSISIHLLAFALMLTQAKASQTIVGKWEAVEPAEGSTEILEFSRSGQFIRSVGVSVSGPYRLDGIRIVFEELTVSLEPSESVELRIEADALVMKVEAEEVRFLRLNRRAPNVPAMVGKWGLKAPVFHADGFWTIELTEDGQCRFRMQTEGEKGRYKTKGDLVTIKESDETRTSSFRFEDGFLILKSRSKPSHEEKYKRIQR